MSKFNEHSNEVDIPPAWKQLLSEELRRPYFIELKNKLRIACESKEIFPAQSHIFRALTLCAPQDVRVVILGQDPYHTPRVADGLAFSSSNENSIPPSLRNIFKEIEREYGTCPQVPDLTDWAKQGVLLLNATLSVEAGKANSHVAFGWHEFTDAVIRTLSEKEEHIVFLLWGNSARQKNALINVSKHLVLESAHPSPLSAHKGFLGNGHFKKANEYLEKHRRGSINWHKLAADS